MSEQPVDDGWCIPDALWARIVPLLPPQRTYPKVGRPRMPDRQAMDAIFSVLRTGCQWRALPRILGAASTVHDRFQAWREHGVFERMGRAGLLAYGSAGWDRLGMASAGRRHHKRAVGGGRNRSQPDRPGETRHQTKPADRWSRHTPRHHGRRGQSARQHDGAAHPGSAADCASPATDAQPQHLWMDKGYDAAAIRTLVAA